MVYRKLFIVGCPRSGTTWLERMINCHPNIVAVLNESNAYYKTYNNFTYLKKQNFKKRLKSAKWLLKSYGLKPFLFGIKSEDLWQGILQQYKINEKGVDKFGPNDRISHGGLHHLVSYAELEQLIAQVRSGSEDDLTKVRILNQLMFDCFFKNNGGTEKQIFLEKTPLHIYYIDVILRQFPEAKSIEIIRDGREVCVSYQAIAKTQSWARQSTKSVIKTWKKAIEAGEKAKADPEIGDRIYSVYYENLRTHLQEELSKIFDFIGLDYDRSLVDSITDVNDLNKVKSKGEGQLTRKGSIGEWQTQLAPQDVTLWQELAGDTLARLGYLT